MRPAPAASPPWMALAPQAGHSHPQDVGPTDPPEDPRPEARPPEGFPPWPDPARRFRSSARGPDPYAVAEREAIQQENAPPAAPARR